jgi:AcrR family transcriptional regulator
MPSAVAKISDRRAAPAERTRERILDGAMRAIARHGLTKLGMNDVSESAGVSRGTLYRYFPSREELLESLAEHESRRFRQSVDDALRAAPAGETRLEVALRQVARYAREHPAIRRIVETEPAFVLGYLRDEFPALRAITYELFAPVLGETRPVRVGAVTAEQMVDWLTRVMISAVLLPDPEPEQMARGLTAVYRLLATPSASRPRIKRAMSKRIRGKGKR